MFLCTIKLKSSLNTTGIHFETWFQLLGQCILLSTGGFQILILGTYLLPGLRQLPLVCNRVVLPSSLKIIKCDQSNESYLAVLFCGAVYYAVQGGSNF